MCAALPAPRVLPLNARARLAAGGWESLAAGDATAAGLNRSRSVRGLGLLGAGAWLRGCSVACYQPRDLPQAIKDQSARCSAVSKGLTALGAMIVVIWVTLKEVSVALIRVWSF